MVGAVSAVMPYKANATPRFSGGKVSARIACAMGWRPPPPAPCRTRNNRRISKLGAKPQRSELKVNTVRHVMKNRFRPKLAAIQPLMGSTMALETRYEVRTQV